MYLTLEDMRCRAGTVTSNGLSHDPSPKYPTFKHSLTSARAFVLSKGRGLPLSAGEQ